VPQLWRDRNVVLQPSYFRSLVLASFADGHVNDGFSQRIKCAALKSRQRRGNHLRSQLLALGMTLVRCRTHLIWAWDAAASRIES
jgi:hypothetical protein